MLKSPDQKYWPVKPVGLADRRWPDAVLRQAPQWCSVDLRDGKGDMVISGGVNI